MKREPFIAHSELTNEIYIIVGKEKYRVTEQAIKAVKAIEALEQEPCEDAISREDTLKAMIEQLGIRNEDYLLPAEATLYKVVKNMPPVKPQEPILDKIKTEIEQEYNRLSATRADETLELGECLGLKMSLKIIDKYKAESEVTK